jgi:hypothetical protein
MIHWKDVILWMERTLSSSRQEHYTPLFTLLMKIYTDTSVTVCAVCDVLQRAFEIKAIASIQVCDCAGSAESNALVSSGQHRLVEDAGAPPSPR